MKGKSKRRSKGRKYNFREKMIEDYYGNSAIRTKFEYLFEGFLKEAGLPYLVNQVFCFSCNKWFTYENREMPEGCYYCRINFKTKSRFDTERGYISRPDFLINKNNKEDEFDLSKISIIRIDGNVHTVKSTSIRDYFILNDLLDLGVKVFVITNDELLSLTVAQIKSKVEAIKTMINDKDGLYRQYIKSKEFEEKTFCPFIELRRLKRR